MKCWAVSHIITDYIESGLGDTERLLVEAHIKECPKCRFEFQRQKAFMEKLKNRDGLNLEDGFWVKYKKELFEKIHGRTKNPLVVLREMFGNAWNRKIMYASATLVAVFVAVYFIKLTFRGEDYFVDYGQNASSNVNAEKLEDAKDAEDIEGDGKTDSQFRTGKGKTRERIANGDRDGRREARQVYGLEVSEKELETFRKTIKEIEENEEFQVDESASMLTESQQIDVLAQLINKKYL